MAKLTKDGQRFLLWALGFILLIVGIGFYLGRKGRRKIAIIDEDDVRPNFPADGWATRFDQEMSGFNIYAWTDKRIELLEDFNNLSDAEIATVYNAYNKTYATYPDTLFSLINGEWIPEGSKIQKTVTDRMLRIGLS